MHDLWLQLNRERIFLQYLLYLSKLWHSIDMQNTVDVFDHVFWSASGIPSHVRLKLPALTNYCKWALSLKGIVHTDTLAPTSKPLAIQEC